MVMLFLPLTFVLFIKNKVIHGLKPLPPPCPLLFFSLYLHHVWLSGLDRYDAARNCTELKAQIPSTLSGQYWIDPDLGSSDNAFEVYCDQETDGGGWTLVWSYQFKRDYWFSSPYETYMSPRPSFPLQYR